MQVYRGMDVGTAKPSPEERRRVPHHLIDVVEPSVQFTAGEFVHRADSLVREVATRGRIPVVCGGTAFYIRNFLFGLPASPPAQLAVRRRLQDLEREVGPRQLHAMLAERDPEAGRRIPPGDRYRTVRALEVLETTGRSVYSFPWPRSPRADYQWLLVGLERPRDELYRRIEERVDRMFAQGLVEEVRRLLAAGYGPRDPGMRGIGYQEFLVMRKGCLGFADVRGMIKLDSRRYAKRQVTFFRAIEGVRWFDAGSLPEVKAAVERFAAAAGSAARAGSPLDAQADKHA